MYSVLADYYDTVVLQWSGAARAASFYVKHMPFSQQDSFTVLDIGCGTGLYAMAILQRFPHAHVWAFDSNEPMVNTLRAKLREDAYDTRAHVFVADMEKPLPIPADIQFDCMVASGVLEYGNLIEIVRNLTPYLKHSGYFFDAAIRDTLSGKILAAFWGCKPLPHSEILRIFLDAGFLSSEIPQLSHSYLLLRHVKEAHLFKRAG